MQLPKSLFVRAYRTCKEIFKKLNLQPPCFSHQEHRALSLQNDLVLDLSKRYVKWMLDFLFSFPLEKIMAETSEKHQRLLRLSGFRFCIALLIHIFTADFPLPRLESVSPQSQLQVREKTSQLSSKGYAVKFGICTKIAQTVIIYCIGHVQTNFWAHTLKFLQLSVHKNNDLETVTRTLTWTPKPILKC